MPFCTYCGKEVTEDDQFCPHCGATITEEPATPRVEPQRGYRREREACFGPPGSGVGLWGSISGAVFLIGLAMLWYFDWFWPGILILIALMAIIGGIIANTRR